jgi:uncharacterized protein DUF6789
MSRIKMGFYSGLVATLITGCMLLMKNALHVIPQLHVARSISELLGMHDSVMPGVIAIFAFGVFVFGGLFANYAPKIPVRSYLGKSILCAVAMWLLWMVVVMPLGGSGFFGLEGGTAVPVGAFVLSLAYWLILGTGFRWLSGPVAQPNAGRVES